MKRLPPPHIRWLVIAGLSLAATASGQEAGNAPTIIIHQRAEESGGEVDRDAAKLRSMLQSAARKLQASEAQTGEEKDRADRMLVQLKEAARRIQKLEDLTRDQAKVIEALTEQRDDALQEVQGLDEDVKALREKLKAQSILVEERTQEVRALQQTAGTRSDDRDGRSAMSAEAYAALTRAADHLDGGEVGAAAEAYRAGMARWPAIHDFRVGLATCHYTGGNPEVADSLCKDVLDQESRHPGALRLRGVIAWEQGDTRAAGKYLDKALKASPDDAQLHVYRGLVHYARGRFKDAGESLEEALALDPNNASARYNLAVLLVGGEEPDVTQARVQYETARRLGSEADPDLEAILYP